jgi:VWFA-related protein
LNLIVVALVGTAASLLSAQQSSFRAGTDVVSVYATVTDRDSGRLVTDLTLRDFEIRDNGQIRPVVLFAHDPQPFTAIVMLDRSGSMFDHFDQVRNSAAEFIRQMYPADRARIGSFSDAITFSPPVFTSDQDELIRILRDDLPDMGPSPVWEAIDQSMTELLPMPDRRVVIVFSDGHDDPARGQGLTTLDDLLRRARVNGVMVYAIGFGGEVTKISRPAFRLPRPTGRGVGIIGLPGGRQPSLPQPRRPAGFTREYRKADPGLRELAEESGGGYFEMEAADHLGETFAAIALELHHQYRLGFVPGTLDGKTHTIDVKARRRGLDVRARRSYVATRPRQ